VLPSARPTDVDVLERIIEAVTNPYGLRGVYRTLLKNDST
jgi:hypothetical protein